MKFEEAYQTLKKFVRFWSVGECMEEPPGREEVENALYVAVERWRHLIEEAERYSAFEYTRNPDGTLTITFSDSKF